LLFFLQYFIVISIIDLKTMEIVDGPLYFGLFMGVIFY